jgi:hypothetical protein
MKLLRCVKDLKEQGFQLKAIKKLLPDLDKFRDMDPKILYSLREELNRQVLQERSYELGQVSPGISVSSRQRDASMERLRQFENMMSQMIRGTMEDMSRESEKRICDQVNLKLQKEMNYLLLQKEELHEKQVTLLKEILSQVKKDNREDDRNSEVSEREAEREAAASMEDKKTAGRAEKALKRGSGREKRRKKKLFAKSVS